jgi:hypothetical protein
MSGKIVGGCLCGGTRYELKVAPEELNDCHCVDCRRASGAAGVTWGTVPRDQLQITSGAVKGIAWAGRVRSFAACCGTPLFFEEGVDSATVDVTIATLDDPTPFPPRKIIWTEDRLPWVKLDEGLPSFRRGSGEG